MIERERAGADDRIGSINKMIGDIDSRLAKYRALLKGKATGVGLGLEGFEYLRSQMNRTNRRRYNNICRCGRRSTRGCI